MTAAHPRNAGFTLLEAIVALTIMAMALIPMVSFISQSADALTRAGDANERSLVTQSALALMDPINPMVEPEGSLPLDEEVTVSWRSEVLVPPSDGIRVGTLLAGFRLGFYGVQVEVSRSGAPWYTFDLRKVGYERIQRSLPFDQGGAAE